MKKNFFAIFAFFLCSITAMAQEISADEALANALTALKSGQSKVKSNAVQREYYRLAYTQMSDGASVVKAPLYYVFEHREGGFIVAGADARVKSLLGNVEMGTYADAMTVPAFKYWCEESKRGLEQAVSRAADDRIADIENHRVLPRTYVDPLKKVTLVNPGGVNHAEVKLPISVAPLLGEINWNQGDPYNRKCPTLGNGERAATGCVATATAMIMKYYEWPTTGVGSSSYQCENALEGVNVTLSADFSKSRYDWSKMLNNYDAEAYTSTQADAVAKLMSDIGIAEQMHYGSSSGTWHEIAISALADHFRYDKSLRCCNRSAYTRDEWYKLICGEIAEKRPVLMCGTNYSGRSAHEFVIDGYDATGLVHVNWGWGGMSNGHFSLDYMNPDAQGIGGSNGGYGGDQQICVGIQPDRTGTSVGTSELYFHDNFELSDDGNYFSFHFTNLGQLAFTGKVGVVVMYNDKNGNTSIYSQKLNSVNGVVFDGDAKISVWFDDIDVSEETIGDGSFTIYPVYEENGECIVMNAALNASNFAWVYLNDSGDNLIFDPGYSATFNPHMESIEAIKTHYGYDAVIRATISIPSGSAEMTCPMVGVLYDGETVKYMTQTYAYSMIGNGETRTVDFSVPADVLEEDKPYYFVVYYYLQGKYLEVVDNEEILFTMKRDIDPQLSFSNYSIRSEKVTKEKKMEGNFVIRNDGGYDEQYYVIFLFGQDSNGFVNYEDYCGYMAYGKRGLEHGDNVIPFSETVNLAPGRYVGQLRKYDEIQEIQCDIKFQVFENGDVNYDEKVNRTDVEVLRNMLLGKTAMTDSGDVNCDNAVTVGDVSTLVKKLTK